MFTKLWHVPVVYAPRWAPRSPKILINVLIFLVSHSLSVTIHSLYVPPYIPLYLLSACYRCFTVTGGFCLSTPLSLSFCISPSAPPLFPSRLDPLSGYPPLSPYLPIFSDFLGFSRALSNWLSPAFLSSCLKVSLPSSSSPSPVSRFYSPSLYRLSLPFRFPLCLNFLSIPLSIPIPLPPPHSSSLSPPLCPTNPSLFLKYTLHGDYGIQK